MSSKHKQKIGLDFSNKPASFEGYVGLPYLRVSSKRQEIEGTGLQSQEKRCLSELERLNIPHEKSFFDSFSGGGDFMNRPAMREMLSYIDTNPHKKFVVIFDDLKRFARDTEFHIKLRTAFKLRGVILLCLSYKFEDSPEGKFVETIFAAQNQLDREQNRRQVIQKQKARLECGYRAFPAVKGYTRTKDLLHGKIDIQNKDAVYIKEALEGFASKRFVHKIDGARFLQEKGVISSKQGAEKALQTFDKMLKEIFYCGYIEYEPWEVTRRLGRHTPIISLEIYEKNQIRLKQKNTTFVRQDIREGFELRGLLNCAGCMTKLTGSRSKGNTGKLYDYYHCNKKYCPMYAVGLSTEIAHTKFINILKEIKPSQELINLAIEIFEDSWKNTLIDLDKNSKNIHLEKEKIENDIVRLAELVSGSKNEIVNKQYEKQIEKKAIVLEEIEEELRVIKDYTIPYRTSTEEVLNVLRNPYSVWNNYDPVRKQRLFSFIFEENLIYDEKEGYRTLNYALPIKLFEEISTTNPLLCGDGGNRTRVHMGRWKSLHT